LSLGVELATLLCHVGTPVMSCGDTCYAVIHPGM